MDFMTVASIANQEFLGGGGGGKMVTSIKVFPFGPTFLTKF